MEANVYPPVKSLVIPLELGNLIVPNNLMVEMIAVDKHTTNEQNLVNWFTWHGKKIPLISLEALCMVEKNHQAKNNCIILSTILDNDELAFIAIQTKGSPHTVEVTEETLRDDHKRNEQRCPYIASHVQVGNIPCMIPDLAAIETVILEMMSLKSL